MDKIYHYCRTAKIKAVSYPRIMVNKNHGHETCVNINNTKILCSKISFKRKRKRKKTFPLLAVTDGWKRYVNKYNKNSDHFEE